MSSFGDVAQRRAPCPTCDREQRIDTLFEKIEGWSDDDADIQGIEEYYLFQCRGCERIFFCNSSSSSEDYYHYELPDGSYETEYPFTKKYFPPPANRTFNYGIDVHMEFTYPKTARLIREAFRAASEGLHVLAAIGARTAFDSAAEDLGIDTGLTFEQKLEALKAKELISKVDQQNLSILIDAGSAAAHRGWNPSETELRSMFSILARFIEGHLSTTADTSALRAKVPPRTRRPKKAEQA